MMLMAGERVGLEYRLEPLGRVASLVPDPNKILQVIANLSFMPGE